MLDLIRQLADWVKRTRFGKTQVGRFVVDVLIELLGVTWPTKEEIKSSTGVVMITLVVVAVYLWVASLVIGFGIEELRMLVSNPGT
jgi:preprotein translocase SecE subunit